jgi:tRNA (guanine-N7-)-methyltransferase
MTDQEPSAAFFGRRKGKPLRHRQASLWLDLLPKLRFSPTHLEIADGKELWLEIGFGGAEHLIETARANPNVRLIGCEPFVNGVAKALTRIEEHQISNISIFDDDVSKILDELPSACLSRIFILYPDPWPKLRHRKRRLISEQFLYRLARIMKRDAELRFATDIDDYAAWTLSRIEASSHFVWEQMSPLEWTTPWEGWISTRYEKKALREGRSPVYLTFRRRFQT